MKRATFILVMIILLTGCSPSENEQVWFHTENEAINHTIKETPIIKGVIGETNYVENEKIVVYKFHTKEGEGIGTATILKKGNLFSWVSNGAGVIVKQDKGNTTITSVIKSASGKKYDLYAGVMNNRNMVIKTRLSSEIKPHVDKESNIYYYLEGISQ